MRESSGEFAKAGVQVVCVMQGTAKQSARFCDDYDLDSVCIGDPLKESYRRMGFGRYSWWGMLFAMPAYARRQKQAKTAGLVSSLKRSFGKHSDILQLPGAALIAKGGTILWVRRATHPGDLPSARELLSLVNEGRS